MSQAPGSNGEMRQSLLLKKEESKPAAKSNTNLRQSVTMPSREIEIEKAKKEEEAKKKKYSLLDFAKFTVPYLWLGGFWIRVQTVITFVLLIASRLLNVTHPLILKYALDGMNNITDGASEPTTGHVYFLVAMYAIVRFFADFVNNAREIPFA